MRKKLSFVLILLLITAIFCTLRQYAESATKARSANIRMGISSVVGIGDLSSGDTIEVDSDGDLSVKPGEATGIVYYADSTIKATAGTVYAVIFSASSMTAGDLVELKDGNNSADTSLITISASASTGQWMFEPCIGVEFSSGIYLDITEDHQGGTPIVTTIYK